MRSARIILEQTSKNHWTAWFAASPQTVFGGPHPDEAVERLLASHPDHGLDLKRASIVESDSSGERIELHVLEETLRARSSLIGVIATDDAFVGRGIIGLADAGQQQQPHIEETIGADQHEIGRLPHSSPLAAT